MIDINTYCFLFYNWFFIGALVFLYWKIRNIRNELNMKKEIFFIMLAWSVFSIVFYLINFILQIYMESSGSKELNDSALFYT